MNTAAECRAVSTVARFWRAYWQGALEHATGPLSLTLANEALEAADAIVDANDSRALFLARLEARR